MNDDVLNRISADLMDILAYVNELRNGAVAPPVVPDRPSGLTRLVAPDGGPLSHGYSTRDPWNLIHSGLVLEHSHGQMGLHDGDGDFFDILPHVKPASPAGGGTIWDRHDKNLFYTTGGNGLYVFDVAQSWGTQPTLVYRFKEYGVVNIGGGEGTISESGDFLPMIGDGHEAFLLNLRTKSIMDGPILATNLNAVYTSTDDRLIMTGEFGVAQVHPRDGKLVSVAYRQEHMDSGKFNGKPIIVWLDDRTNTVTMIPLDDPNHPVPLLQLDWALALHICLPTGKPYAIVSPYAPKGEDVPHAHDILKVPLDGSTPTVLAQHHSDTTTGSDVERYSGQPHAVASGNQFLFDSREEGKNVVYIGTF